MHKLLVETSPQAAKTRAHRSHAQGVSRARPQGAPCAARAKPLDTPEHASTMERPAAAILTPRRPRAAPVASFVSESAFRFRFRFRSRLRLRLRFMQESVLGVGTEG